MWRIAANWRADRARSGRYGNKKNSTLPAAEHLGQPPNLFRIHLHMRCVEDDQLVHEGRMLAGERERDDAAPIVTADVRARTSRA